MALYYRSAVSVLLFCACLAVPVSAESLRNILQDSLSSAPEILEAGANIQSAQHRTEQASAQHWPVVSVAGNKIIDQYHRERDDYYKTRFTPSVKAEMNLYAFGAIEKNVERSRKEEEYYQHRYSSTQEELAYTISRLYLQALNMKEAVQIMRKSLQRHKKILANLDVIASNDIGRESEYVQAEARIIMIEQNINRYNKQLSNTLANLSKYTKLKIDERNLHNPFKSLTDEQLFTRYSVKEKSHNPIYKAQQTELETRQLAVQAENSKDFPKVNLVGSASRDDRYVGVEVSWDILNRGNSYSVQEKTSEVIAASQRLERISRDIDNISEIAKINIQESRTQLKTLKAQIAASAKVVDFYQMQFDIARRSLLDVLNAERELADVELSFVNTEHELRSAMLDYLYSQGKITAWGNVKTKNNLNFK